MIVNLCPFFFWVLFVNIVNCNQSLLLGFWIQFLLNFIIIRSGLRSHFSLRYVTFCLIIVWLFYDCFSQLLIMFHLYTCLACHPFDKMSLWNYCNTFLFLFLWLMGLCDNQHKTYLVLGLCFPLYLFVIKWACHAVFWIFWKWLLHCILKAELLNFGFLKPGLFAMHSLLVLGNGRLWPWLVDLVKVTQGDRGFRCSSRFIMKKSWRLKGFDEALLHLTI